MPTATAKRLGWNEQIPNDPDHVDLEPYESPPTGDDLRGELTRVESKLPNGETITDYLVGGQSADPETIQIVG